MSVWRAATVIYAAALRAFPAAHRARYGAEMIDAYERELEARRLAGGRSRALRFVAAAALDAVRAGLGQRQYQRDRWRDPRRGGAMRIGMSWLDVKLGLRMCLRFPGLTIAGGLALVLAIGIGAGWHEVAGDLLRPALQFPGGDRLVEIEMRDAARGKDERRLLHDFLDWRRDVRSLEEIGAYRTLERNLILGDARPEPVTVAEISATAFRLTQVPPLLGRPLLESDEQPGAPPVVVIGYGVWQARFGGRADAVGETVRLGRATTTVVGVMPEGYAFPVNHSLWTPLQLRPSGYAPLEGVEIRVFGRVAPGSTQAAANVELTTLVERTAAASPSTHQRLRPRVLAWGGESPGDSSWMEFFITHLPVLLILTVACANVATLIYARTATREAEITLRYSLGATRGRIVSQLFVEALVLSSAAAIVGLFVANAALKWGIAAFYAAQNQPMPFWMHPGLKITTVLYAAALTIVGAGLLGILPAIKATGAHAHAQLKTLGAGGSTLRFGWIWTSVMILQVALTVICIPPAWGISEEAIRDRRIRDRFPTEKYVAARVTLDQDAPTAAAEDTRADYSARLERTYRELERRIAQEPGVEAVTYGDRLPGMGVAINTGEFEAAPATAPVTTGTLWTAAVGSGFFETFQIPIVAGRDFHDGDRTEGARTILVNEAFARRYMGGASPVGRRLRFGSGERAAAEPWLDIVGMVRDIGMTPTDQGEAPYVFRAASPATTSPLVMGVRIASDPEALAPRLRAVALTLDPALRLDNVRSLEDLAWQEDVPALVVSALIGTVVALGLFLSAAGIFSLMSVSVARRTREIGLRQALGASQTRLLAGIFSRALVLIGSGIAIGNIVLVIVITQVAEVSLSEFAGGLVTTSAMMLTVGLLACVEPARRALRIHPADALKEA